MSSHTLTPGQISLLSKNLKFCPTPDVGDLLELEVNMKEFVRKLEIMLFMSNSGSSKPEHILSRAGQFIPPENNEKNFVSVESQIISKAESLDTLQKPVVNSNLTPGEKIALKELKNNNGIIIRPFDKGNGLCIFDRNVYIEKNLQHFR